MRPVTIVEYASMTCPHCAHFHDDDAARAQDEIHRHRQGAADLPRVSVRSARRGGLHACPLLERQLFPDGRRAVQAAGVLGRASRMPSERCCRSPNLPVFHRRVFEACLTDQKLLDDVRAVRKRGAEEFKVELDADLLHQWKARTRGPCRLRKCRRSSTACSDRIFRAGPRREWSRGLRAGWRA